ncbi:MAG: Glyoxalase/bleomycin resistance protein/dioxygenase [Myxococcales bacterium]|nr:Glyoxalase/bleomycin resistance protein/dioxygenase [Myxococcales bacterium]
MSNPFSYAELHTKDPAAAKTFYGQLFEWKMSDHPNAVGTYTEIDLGEGFPAGLLQTGAKLSGSAALASYWLPYIRVSDVAAATTRARSLGAASLQDIVEIPEGRFSVLTDPTGAPFGLFQPVVKE